MPNPQYFSKLRTFLEGQGRRKIGRRSKAHHRQVDNPSVFCLETLEPRVMLAADLAGAVQAAQVMEPLVAQVAPIAISHEVSQTVGSSETILGQLDNVPSVGRRLPTRVLVTDDSVTV